MHIRPWHALLPLTIQAAKILQSNDDGWAEINIRTFNEALNAAGHDVLLSAPAENQSGTGSSDEDPVPRVEPCEFNSCPANSAAIGSNTTDSRLNYVNSHPVTSVRLGLTEIAPQFFGLVKPDLVVTGPNVGSNLDVQVSFSGTIGAAVYASHDAGIPAIAFSASSGDPTAWNAMTPLYAQIYADLATALVNVILTSGTPYLPNNTWLNVNFATVTDTTCNDVSQFKFVLSRINPSIPFFSTPDVETCGSNTLPMERKVVGTAGCYASVSVGDASDKTTATAASTNSQSIRYSGMSNLNTVPWPVKASLPINPCYVGGAIDFKLKI